jgi:hypothetical protein
VASDAVTGRALRAVREAHPGRRVLLTDAPDALGAVASGEARLAIAAAAEFVGEGQGEPRPFEAVGLVGQTFAHVISLGEATDVAGGLRLATGPVGSASHRTGAILSAGIEGIELVPVEDGALTSAEADAALVIAPLGAPAVVDLAASGRLLSLAGWNTGNNLVRYPQLREARIPAGTYPGQDDPVDTLASQLVLAGPSVDDVDAVGPQGPGATQPTQLAQLAASTVRAIDAALASPTGLDPSIPRAAALTPALPAAAASISPSPDIALLTVGVMLLFGWLVWLYVRPERR